ncbi:MAG: hypothetical protein U0939_18665 [Pirellulales bacterium]
MTPQSVTLVAGCLLLSGLVTVTGCRSDRPPTYPVRGRVVFPDGSPVRTGSIELRSRTHSLQASGEIDSEGRFELTTFEPGDGAVAGEHEAVVVQFVMAENLRGGGGSTLGVVHPRFAAYSTSPLRVHVKEQGENRPELQVDGIQPGRGSSSGRHDHPP